MDFFSKKTVVGLFDNEEDLEHALSDLHEQEFGRDEDDLILIDENYQVGENPFFQPGNKEAIVTPTSSSGVGGAVINTASTSENNVSETALKEKLTDLGVDTKEASFYAQQISRGNTLVVVKTGNNDKAQQVHDIMRRFNAKSSIS